MSHRAKKNGLELNSDNYITNIKKDDSDYNKDCFKTLTSPGPVHLINITFNFHDKFHLINEANEMERVQCDLKQGA